MAEELRDLSSGKSGMSATKGYDKGFIADSFGFGVERE
jgi:hypothetical protein